MEDNKQYIDEQEKMKSEKLSDEELWMASSVADDTYSYNVDKAFERFKKRIAIEQKETKHFSLSWNWKIATVAAVAIVLLGFVSLTAYWQGAKNVERNFSDIIVEAPLGSKTKLQLPDGSVVWLNAGSRMVYSQGFGVNDRNLEFSGEGYFEVQKNKNLPFTVKNKDVNVTVLGTKFNFRNYEGDKEAVVNLLEGKVSCEGHLNPGDLKYLSPSEKMILNKETGKINIIKSKKVIEASDWKNNILLFDEDLLPDIVSVLERSYNVRIVIANEQLKNERFYGSFNRLKQSIYNILDILSETGHLEYKEENDIIYLN